MSRHLFIAFAFFVVFGFSSHAQSPASIQSLSISDQARLSQAIAQQQQTSTTVAAPTPDPEKEKARKTAMAAPSPVEQFFKSQSDSNSLLSIGINSPSFKESSGKSIVFSEDNANSQFGYSAFSDASEFKKMIGFINPGPNYTLGVGDVLDVKIWGKFQNQLLLTVDESGRVFIPEHGYIFVSGQTLSQATERIREKISTLYTNFQLDVSLSKLRTIKVFVLGEVFSPGSYEVVSLSTLLNGLYMSGGPKKSGSLRKIKLIRNNRVIKVIDLYDYLLRGDHSQDPQLQTLDTIFVPIIGDVIQVKGVVKRPGIYEVEDGTNANKAIFEYAGGPSIGYYGKHIQIERIIEGEKKVIADLKFNNAKEMETRLKTYKIHSGDTIKVLPIYDALYQVVAIKGNVQRPGEFEFKAGMTLQDLLTHSGGLLDDTYKDRVNIYRRDNESQRTLLQFNLTTTSPSQIKISEFDVVEIFSNRDVRDGDSVSISGDVKNQGVYRLFNQMTLSDLLFLAKPLDTAFVENLEVIHQDVSGNRTRDLYNKSQFSSVFLTHLDQVFVRQDSSKLESSKVVLSGQVKYPGTYVILDGETLNSVIKRAGGYTEKAFLPGLVFTRGLQTTDQQGYQRIIHEERKRLLYEQTQSNEEGKLVQLKQSQEEALTFLTQEISRGVNRLVISANDQDIKMRNGDSIFVPEMPRVVQVYGGVKQPTSLLFERDKKLKYYISKAGGYTQYAVPKRLIVVRANGVVLENPSTIELGDSIYVPEDIKIKRDFISILLDVTKILANVATTVLLLRTL